MNAPDNLSHELRLFAIIKERIAEIEGLYTDDEFVIGTAEGESNLPELIAQMIREARHTEAMAQGLKALMADSKERLERLTHKAEKLRQIAHFALCEAGIKKIEQPDFTATRSAGRRAVIVTEDNSDLIPDAYVRVKREVDKTKIKQALESGEDLSFAFLSNADEVLTVRAK